jgi:hypothetical protein
MGQNNRLPSLRRQRESPYTLFPPEPTEDGYPRTDDEIVGSAISSLEAELKQLFEQKQK